MEPRLSDYLTTPKYRSNSGTLYEDLQSFVKPRKLPTWWQKFKPSSHAHPLTGIVTYPSYWAARFVGRMQTAGIQSHKLNLGYVPNKPMTNDDVRRITAARMMNRVQNARTYLGNEALYRHK